MGVAQSSVTSSAGFPRLLIAENNFSTFESLIDTFGKSRLDLNFDLCTSRDGAMRKLLDSPYQLIISDAHLAEMDEFSLLKRSQAREAVPFLITANASNTQEKESARRVLEHGAFDLISLPLEFEQTTSAILLALWESKLMTLIGCKERAVEKYREHMAAYPSGNQMDATFKRTLSAIHDSIVSYQQTILWTEGFTDLATKVANQARKKALERLDALSVSVREPSPLLAEPISILLIDANHHDRECYAQRLKASSSNFDVVQAATGRAGLDICARKAIDCVMLEIDLPDMSGFQVLEYLVWNASHPQMAVVVLTGLSNEHFLELALKNGAQAALQKRTPSAGMLEESILKAIATVKQNQERYNRPIRMSA